MTKTEAREALAATWRFSRVGDDIALREVALIEAVRTHELSSPPGAPTSPVYAEPPRPS